MLRELVDSQGDILNVCVGNMSQKKALDLVFCHEWIVLCNCYQINQSISPFFHTEELSNWIPNIHVIIESQKKSLASVWDGERIEVVLNMTENSVKRRKKGG